MVLLALVLAADAAAGPTRPASLGFPASTRVRQVASSPLPLADPPPPPSAEAALRVAELGEGPPVLLLPGLLGSAYAYRALAPRLAAREVDPFSAADEVLARLGLPKEGKA